ncbi:hypothetical protein GQ457_01G022070 [Hibiscus cannabinus]
MYLSNPQRLYLVGTVSVLVEGRTDTRMARTDTEAPKGHSSPRLYEIAGSRPPDGIPQVSRFPPLERPASPTLLEQQRSAKKAKGNSEIDSGHDSMTIDDDQSVGSTVVETDMNQQTEGNQDGEKSTYVGKVMANCSVGIGANGPTSFREDDVTILEDDIILDRNRPIPSIQFSDRVHDQIDHNLRSALIVRLLGRTIGYNVILSRIHALLKPIGSLQLFDLENNYFIVRFSNESDYTRVLTDGLWTIFGSYLLVQTWSRNFTTSEKYLSQVIVWVRIPGLPYRYYNKALFRYIALLLGKVVRVDYNTTDGFRGKFACLAIAVDLNQPLISCIRIDGKVRKLEYEGLHNICFDCGVYGHSKDCCPLSKKKDEVAIEAGIDKQHDVLISESNLYGPWMVVDNKRRRTFNSTRGDTLGASKSKPQSGSRFEVLDVDDGSDQQHNEDVVIMGNLTAQEKELQGADGFTASGRPTNVVEHVPKIVSGFHSAIRIIKDGHLSAGTMSIESKSMGCAGKVNLEGANKGFKVKKLMDSKVARSNVVEWVKSAHTRIDQHTVSGIMVGDGSSERNLAMDGIPRAPTIVEVEHNSYNEVMSDNRDRMMDSLGGDHGIVADRVVARMGFPNSYSVETNGFSGGIWLLWDDTVVIRVKHVANQFITALVEGSCFQVNFYLTVVYASPMAVKHKLLRGLLAESKPPDHVPWVLGGDFNALLDDEELVGGNLYQRLDRCLVNSSWLDLFSDAMVQNLDQLDLDHRPILLYSQGRLVNNNQRPFRFISAWKDHSNFPEFLKSVWHKEGNLREKLVEVQTRIAVWNKEIFGHIGQRKKRHQAQIRGNDLILEYRHSNYLSNLAANLRIELDEGLNQEESFWRQKACAKWIVDGDRNTKFYHASIKERRRHNYILVLRRDDDAWTTNQEELVGMARDYFVNLFTSSGGMHRQLSGHGRFPRVDTNSLQNLEAPITDEEVWHVIFELRPMKALGVDGFNVGLFQKNWAIVGSEVL